MPTFPFLVVIKITPKAARAPYIADDAPSFKTDIVSTSFGFIVFRLRASTPSTKIKGLALLLIDPIPLMFKFGSALISPLPKVTFNPGDTPCNICPKLGAIKFSIWLEVI